MFVDGIGDLFRLYCDEDDETFLAAAQVTSALTVGYDQFRRQIVQTDPYSYAARVSISPTSDFYDLADAANPTRILGASLAPAGTRRLYQLLKVVNVDTAGAVNWYYRGAGSFEEMDRLSQRYILSGTVLRFSEDQSGETVRIEYVPVSAVDWTQLTAGDNEFVDDFDAFHDLIALYAYKQYSIRDGAPNPELDGQLKRRELELELYLSAGRVPEMSDHILDERRVSGWR